MIMSHFIIIAIAVLVATKAKAQTKDNLTDPKRGEKSECKRRSPIKGRAIKYKS
jgi:hypothetical protein